MRAFLLSAGCCVLGLSLVAGCENMNGGNESSNMDNSSKMTSSNKSLYDRLGGEKAIKAVCDDFVNRAASDPKVNFFRKDVPGYNEWKPTPQELATFKKHLVEFVEVAAGGPQHYEGKPMKEVHKGMKITSAQFDAAASDLSASLDKFNVPIKEKNELLQAVAGTKPDIVEQ